MTSIFHNSLSRWMRKRIQKKSHNPQGEEQTVIPIKIYPDKSSCWNPLISTFGNSCKVNYSSLRWKKANFWHLLWQWHALTFLELTSLKINDALKSACKHFDWELLWRADGTGTSYCKYFASVGIVIKVWRLRGGQGNFFNFREGVDDWLWIGGNNSVQATQSIPSNNSKRECKAF